LFNDGSEKKVESINAKTDEGSVNGDVSDLSRKRKELRYQKNQGIEQAYEER